MAGHRNPAFDAAVLGLLDEVFDFARRLTRDEKSAEDLTQAAYAKAFANFHRFQPGTSARAWLFTLVRHLHFNEARGARRHPTIALEDEPPAPLGDPAPDLTRELDQAIDRLPVKLREVVVLDLQGLTCKEIGAVVNCPPGTVMSRLFKARQVLREALSRDAQARGGRG